MKGVAMKVSSGKHLLVSVVAIVGLMMAFGQASVFAQSLGSQLLNGGFFQRADDAEDPNSLCQGQCVVENWQTGDCSCPEGFTFVPASRILVDVGTTPDGGPLVCGTYQWVCVRP
jgi:hypothetical protein